LKIYSKNKLPGNDSFVNVIIEAFFGITRQNLQYLENAVEKDFDNTLVIHANPLLFTSKKSVIINEKSILNDSVELAELYRISGFKHLLIIGSNDLDKKKENVLRDTFFCYTEKAGIVWLDHYLSSFFERGENDSRFRVLPHMLNDVVELYKLLDNGLVKDMAKTLGYYYQVRGTVVQGNSLGRKIGYPTANISPCKSNKKIPTNGVYVAFVNFDDQWHKCIVNIGMRPTLSREDVTIEAHIIDFEGDLYGKKITVHFLDRLRDEIRFPTLEALKNQIIKDEQNALSALKDAKKLFYVKEGFCFTH